MIVIWKYYSTYETETTVAAYDLWKDFEIYTDYNGTYASEMYSLEAENIISNHDQASNFLND